MLMIIQLLQFMALWTSLTQFTRLGTMICLFQQWMHVVAGKGVKLDHQNTHLYGHGLVSLLVAENLLLQSVSMIRAQLFSSCAAREARNPAVYLFYCQHLALLWCETPTSRPVYSRDIFIWAGAGGTRFPRIKTLMWVGIYSLPSSWLDHCVCMRLLTATQVRPENWSLQMLFLSPFLWIMVHLCSWQHKWLLELEWGGPLGLLSPV